MECECVDGKIEKKSNVPKLLVEHEKLKISMESMTDVVANKDTWIVCWRLSFWKSQSEGSGWEEQTYMTIYHEERAAKNVVLQ